MKEITNSISSFGYLIDKINYDNWKEKLFLIKSEEENVLFPLLHYFDGDFPLDAEDIFFSKNNMVQLQLCKPPKITTKIIHGWLKSFLRSEIIPLPSF